LFAKGVGILHRLYSDSYYIRPSTFCLDGSSCFILWTLVV